MARYEDLPYRTCVGMMLINAAGLVFIGRRAGGVERPDRGRGRDRVPGEAVEQRVVDPGAEPGERR